MQRFTRLCGGKHRFSSLASDPALEPLNILVVGLGRMGCIRAKEFFSSPNSNLLGVVDSNQDRTAQFEKEYRVNGFSSLSEAIKHCNGSIHGVWLSTPTGEHEEQIHSLLEEGLPIGTEKPISDSVDAIRRCYTQSQEKQVPIFCSFQRRFDASYAKLRNSVLNGDIGELYSIHATFRDYPIPPPEFLATGGNIFMDLAVHDIDYILQLMKNSANGANAKTGAATLQLPAEVYANCTGVHPAVRNIPNCYDLASLQMYFPSGQIASIDLSRTSSYGYDQRIEVFGGGGMLTVDHRPTTALVHASLAGGIATDTPLYSFPQRFAQAFQDECEHFLRVVRGEVAPAVTAEECIGASRIVQAAIESAKTKSVVALEEIP